MKTIQQPQNHDRVTLKIRFTSNHHNTLKMAAAEQEVTIAEFLRTAVFDAAEQAVKNFFDREMAQKVK